MFVFEIKLDIYILTLLLIVIISYRYAETNFIDSAFLTDFEGKDGQEEYILEQLLNIAGLLDFSDEVGRYAKAPQTDFA